MIASNIFVLHWFCSFKQPIRLRSFNRYRCKIQLQMGLLGLNG